MEHPPGSSALGDAMRVAIAISAAIVCLGACSSGCGGCSDSRGCGGCVRERDEHEIDRGGQEASGGQGTSTPAARVAGEVEPSAGRFTDIVAPSLAAPASGGALEIYPPPPVGHFSRDFRVRVGGKPAYVERYGGVSYVRFAFRGSADVDIDVDAPIAAHRVLPADAVSASSARGSTLRLSLLEPASVVVWIDALEKLFVLADPIEPAPVAGTDGVASVADHGAAANAPGVVTAEIQSAIDDVSTRSGGGTVLFPPGRYVTGTLRVKSHVALYLAAGALLEASPEASDHLLLVDQASAVRIRGRGTIDGSGRFPRQHKDAAPDLLCVRASQDVTLEDVMFRDSTGRTVHFLASRGAFVHNVKVLGDRTSLDTDGIVADASMDVTIDSAFVYAKGCAICDGTLCDDITMRWR